jgi:hypothetical protein
MLCHAPSPQALQALPPPLTVSEPDSLSAAVGVELNRLQNICITLDKAKHCLNQPHQCRWEQPVDVTGGSGGHFSTMALPVSSPANHTPETRELLRINSVQVHRIRHHTPAHVVPKPSACLPHLFPQCELIHGFQHIHVSVPSPLLPPPQGAPPVAGE